MTSKSIFSHFIVSLIAPMTVMVSGSQEEPGNAYPEEEPPAHEALPGNLLTRAAIANYCQCVDIVCTKS